MSLRFALRIAMTAAAIVMAMTVAGPPSRAQTPPVTPAAPEAKPDAKQDTKPAETAPADPAEPADAFGEDTTLTAQPIVYLKGTGTWDKAFETITGAFKKVKAYVDKEGLKADGLNMTIFTSTDDTGFQYQAAVPVAELPEESAAQRRHCRRPIAGGACPQVCSSRVLRRTGQHLRGDHELSGREAARGQGHVHRAIRDRPGGQQSRQARHQRARHGEVNRHDHSCHACPGCNVRNRSGGIPEASKAWASATSGASIGSSVSWNVP